MKSICACLFLIISGFGCLHCKGEYKWVLITDYNFLSYKIYQNKGLSNQFDFPILNKEGAYLLIYSNDSNKLHYFFSNTLSKPLNQDYFGGFPYDLVGYKPIYNSSGERLTDKELIPLPDYNDRIVYSQAEIDDFIKYFGIDAQWINYINRDSFRYVHWQYQTKNRKIEGVYKQFYIDGKLLCSTSFKGGIRNGISVYLANNGDTLSYTIFKNDVATYSKRYSYKNGRKLMKYKLSIKEGFKRTYYENGRIEKEWQVNTLGATDGYYKYWDTTGNLIESNAHSPEIMR